MGKPIVNLAGKKIKYKNIEYDIVGTDSNNVCIVGENTTLNQYIIHWTKRVKKTENSDECKINGLARDNCLILNYIAHNTLSKAIVEYEEYCTQK